MMKYRLATFFAPTMFVSLTSLPGLRTICMDLGKSDDPATQEFYKFLDARIGRK